MYGGPASSWEGSQVVFAAGNLKQLSKPSNKILSARARSQGGAPFKSPSGRTSGGAGLTDSLQVLHHGVHHGPHARPVALGAQGLLQSGGLVGQPWLTPLHWLSWDPQDSGLRLFLPLPSYQVSHLCCKVSRT